MNRQAAQPPESSAQWFPRRPQLALVALLTFGALSVARYSRGADEPSAAAPHGAATSAGSHLSDEENEREAEAIARSIMSPFCPGRTVSACPVAGPWRAD